MWCWFTHKWDADCHKQGHIIKLLHSSTHSWSAPKRSFRVTGSQPISDCLHTTFIIQILSGCYGCFDSWCYLFLPHMNTTQMTTVCSEWQCFSLWLYEIKRITLAYPQWHWRLPAADQCLTCRQMNEAHSEQNAHSRPASHYALKYTLAINDIINISQNCTICYI